MKKIFIVEDDKAISQSLSFVLQDEGYEVKTAENGIIALNLLYENVFKPSLILLDMTMPVMSGPEFCQTLKNNCLYSSIPIVIMSAYDDIPKKFPEISAEAYLVKPFNIEEMFSIIEKMI